jgi:hypothetical protein
VPPGFTIFVLLINGLLAMAAGALAGVLASFILRLPIRAVWKDAVLGLLGFMVFYAANLFFQVGPLDPLPAGLVIAALCAIVRHVLRFRNLRWNPHCELPNVKAAYS